MKSSQSRSSWLWSLPVLMGLGCCPVLFSWLGELVPVFWLMELDLISLKSSSVSNSRFSGVYGFSMSLGSPSGFGSVRHVNLCGHFKVALSAYLHSCQPPTCLWDHYRCFCSALHCWLKPARQGLGWIFSQLPNCALCVGEACVHLFRLTGLPFLSWGQCVPLSTPLVGPLHRKGCVCWRGLYASPLSVSRACRLVGASL